jgi:hypothetical protein
MPLRSVPIEFVRNNRWSKTTNGDNLKHPDRALARLTAGEVPSVSIWSAE